MPDDLVLLSDFNRDFGSAYGILNDSPSGMRNILRRCVFIIDPDGTLRHRWDVPDPPRIPTADEILEVLKKPASA